MGPRDGCAAIANTAGRARTAACGALLLESGDAPAQLVGLELRLPRLLIRLCLQPLELRLELLDLRLPLESDYRQLTAKGVARAVALMANVANLVKSRLCRSGFEHAALALLGGRLQARLVRL